MPRKTKKQNGSRKEQNMSLDAMIDQMRLSESYMSLLLGILVVIIAGLFLFLILRGRHVGIQGSEEVTKKQSAESIQESAKPLGIYDVQQGDSLKKISVKYFGSQDAFAEIVRYNKLQNPDVIEPGTKLTIPRIDKKKFLGEGLSDDQKKPIKDSTYEILEGDSLWNIAVRAYGDGYKWQEIAKVNNIDVSFDLPIGYKLTIPR